MEKVSREAVEDAIEKIFNSSTGQTEIHINELIHSLVEQFSHHRNELSQEQKNKLGETIFFHPDVLKQLKQSDLEPEQSDISSYDEYLKFKNEVFNERK
ncbi:hypothetical protein [Paenibacillus sp. LHD-38]|uniref:hypothetical protein n=1 Tax=Paenibacillus sp. LHD-38 TaxID=3072143 RepID=UPI00280FA5AE|nr:hypothetical protein [Paenibacillus sp. LHD-38]MDQ8735777.1 hypothetical protein [Paenibacillus sp. LHD-38]